MQIFGVWMSIISSITNDKKIVKYNPKEMNIRIPPFFHIFVLQIKISLPYQTETFKGQSNSCSLWQLKVKLFQSDISPWKENSYGKYFQLRGTG